MSEQKESSVLFSLKELMNLEEDRQREEEEAKAARVRADEEAKMAAERAAADAQQARIRAEEERRRAEEQRQREEAARLEAIRHAEVEKARLEAEQQGRMSAMAAQQHHERQLEVIRSDKGKKTLRNSLIGVVIAVLAIGSVVGVVVKGRADDAERERIELADKNRKAEEELEALKREVAAKQQKVKEIESALAAAPNEAEVARLKKELEAAQKDVDSSKGKLGPKVGGPAVGGDKPGATPKPPCNCKPTDPLCDCL